MIITKSAHKLHRRRSNVQWTFMLGLIFYPAVCSGQTQDAPLESTPNRISQTEEASTSHDPATCSKCRNGETCVHGLTDYPAMQNTYGNPYRIWDCRDSGDCDSTVLQRWKRSMQASHWGYPEYFHRNTFGHSNRNAFSNNIRDGAIERATIYLMDFYPEQSPYAHMLTPKGLERLEKAICVSKTFGSPMRLEKSSRPELNQLRLQWLSEHPTLVASGMDPTTMVWVSNPSGIMASEAIRSYQRGLSASSGQSSVGSSSAGSLPSTSGTNSNASMGFPKQ